jgi:hypothetical protein
MAGIAATSDRADHPAGGGFSMERILRDAEEQSSQDVPDYLTGREIRIPAGWERIITVGLRGK